jgi:membrane protein implicated in regulation of membrane protease activity
MLGVMTARLDVMVFGVAGMTMGGMGVVRRLFMIAGFVVLGGFTVMPGGMLVVFGCLGVMLDVGVVAHVALPGLWLEVDMVYASLLTPC